MPLTLENLVTLEEWQQILSAVDSATTFHDHATTFKGSQAVRIPDDLQKILHRDHIQQVHWWRRRLCHDQFDIGWAEPRDQPGQDDNEWLRQLVLKSEPNGAHPAIAAIADRVKSTRINQLPNSAPTPAMPRPF